MASPAKKWLARHRDALRSPLARAWAWVFVGNGFRIACQAIVFLAVIARLGPKSYGTLLSANAVATLLATFSGFGLGFEMIRVGSVTTGLLRPAWRQAARFTLSTGLVLSAVGTAISYWWMGTELALGSLFLVHFTECVVLRITDVAGGVLQATNRLRLVAETQSVAAAIRMFSAVAFWMLAGNPSPSTWIALSAAAAVLGAIYTLVVARNHLPKSADAHTNPMRLRDGWNFVFGNFIRNLGPEAQRIVLAAHGQVFAAGIYGVAYRVIDTACLAGRSLAFSTTVRFFEEGARGLIEPRRFAIRLILPTALMTLLGAVGLVLFGPALSLLSAAKFQESVPLVQWLCLFPFISGMGMLANGVLTGAGRQNLRNILLLGATAINICLCMLWIPTHSYWGAAAALLLSETVFALATWASLYLISTIPSGYQSGPIRLLYVLEATGGGSRRHLLELINGLISRFPGRYSIHLIYSTGRADKAFLSALPLLSRKGVALHRIDMVREPSLLKDLRAFFSIAYYARHQNIQIIHSHSAKAGFLGRLAGLFVPGARTVYTPHSSPFRKSALFWFLEWVAARFLTDALIAVSLSESQELIQAGIVSPKKAHTIYNGIPANDRSKRRAA